MQPETSASLSIVDYELVTDEQRGSSVMLALQVYPEADGMVDEQLRRERLDSFLQGIQLEKTPAVDEVKPELLQLKLTGDLAGHLTMILAANRFRMRSDTVVSRFMSFTSRSATFSCPSSQFCCQYTLYIRFTGRVMWTSAAGPCCR